MIAYFCTSSEITHWTRISHVESDLSWLALKQKGYYPFISCQVSCTLAEVVAEV